MNSAWISIVTSIEPNYHHYAKMLEEGPKVKAVLEYNNYKWRIHVQEDWGDVNIGHMYYTASYINRDICVDWTAEQLSNQKFVTRVSYDQWDFQSKRAAEKFITMFNLRWAQ